MKKVIGLLSVLGIVVALYQLQSLHRFRHGEHSAFSSFPLNQPRPVEINWEESTLQNGSNRERNDQIRDWLLMAVLSDAELGPSEIRSTLVDMPPARLGYLEPVSTFEYGETRSRAIGHGKVLALIPAKQNKEQRADSLAQVADDQQKNTGRQPKELLVFEYSLGSDGESATITRRSSVSAASLFAPTNGYFTARIHDRDSLERFLKQVDDITDAHMASDGVLISGRKLHAGYRGVDIEDVAALWQSDARLYQAEEQIKIFEEKINAFNKKWAHVTYYTQSEKLELEEQNRTEKAELDAEAARLRTEFKRHRPVKGSGFSLDPTYDYEKFKQHAQLFLRILRDVPENEKSKALQALDDHDEAPFLSLLFKVRENNSNPFVLELLEGMQDADRFQAARYDGDLQGTKVGMTLFYTDLLAKLKAIDYWSDGTIRGFKALTDVHVSRIYEKEQQELPNTRVWFGPQDRGFQVASQEILFGRNATRIYAASSDPLQPGKEAAPNASSQAFLGWWDDHYEEVGQLEPEYQRLNEIMKWSLLLSWLSEKHNNALSYLNEVSVTHNLWFPDWAAGNHQLRYQDWDRFHFFERGYKGSTTEAMPILYSKDFRDFGQVYQISGGVSLGNKDVIHERPLLAPEFQADELSLRPARDFRSSSPNEISMIGGVKHTFSDAGGQPATLSTIEKPGVKLREISIQISPKAIERSYDAGDGKLNIDLKVGDADLARFHSDVALDRPIRVSFQPRDMDRGQRFAEQLSSAVGKGHSAQQFIMGHPDVEEFYRLGPDMGCDGCLLVKLYGAASYMKMQPEENSSADVPAGWQARAASLDDGAQDYNLAWVSQNDFVHKLGRDNFIKIPNSGGSGGGSIPPTFTRGPPPDSSSGDGNLGGHTFRIFTDRENNKYIPAQDVKDLPPHWQDLLQAQRSWEIADKFRTLIVSGNQEKLLLAITNDPSKGKKAIDETKSEALADFDKALSRAGVGQARFDSRVLSQLDHGPDIRARSAVMAVELGDLEAAVQQIADLARQSSQNVDRGLDIINRHLQSADLSDADRENLVQLAAMLDLRSGHALTDRSRIAPGRLGELRAFTDDGHVALIARLTEQVSNSSVVSPNDIRDGGPLYVLDTASAKGNVALFETMPDQIPRDLGKTVRIPRSDLAYARPLVIETPDGRTYRLAGDTVTWKQARWPSIRGSAAPGPTPGSGPGSYRHYNPNAPPCTDVSQHGDERRDDCKQDVYLYEPPPKQVAQSH